MTAKARLTWKQALAWRMRRQFLDPAASAPVERVIERLCGVQAQVASTAELAIRLRQADSSPGEVTAALADGRAIKTWAMRGTLHLLAAEDAGAFLALMAAGKTWERPSWQRYFGVTPADWEVLRPAVREILDGEVLTREQLISRLTEAVGFEHLGEKLRSGWGTLLKPLAWQGDLCFGPNQGQRVTFTRPETASSRWRGLPPVEEAAQKVIEAYASAYGPITQDRFANWISRGWYGMRIVRGWFAEMGDRLAEVDVEGERAFVRAVDLDEIESSEPTDSVRLLAGFDQWVLGPGTDDTHVIASSRRAAVSRQSGWIAPVAIAGGVVSGTWELDGDAVRVAWFTEAGPPPEGALQLETERLTSILARPLTLQIAPS